MPECTFLGWLNVSVLTVTAGILVWYTIETWRLRKEAQLQTELQSRPFLSLVKIESTVPGVRAFVAVRNLGRGVARNVQLDLIRIDDSIELRSSLMTHIGPGVDATPTWRVSSRVLVGGEISEHAGADHGPLAASILTNPAFSCSIVLTYSSLVGPRYRTTHVATNGGAEIEITEDCRLSRGAAE